MNHDQRQLALFKLLHGDSSEPLHIADIPAQVRSVLSWKTVQVFITYSDAQKIRHHPQHGMDGFKALQLPLVVWNGDYYQTTNRGSGRQIEVVLHEPDNPKRAYFLVLARNAEDTGIFLRTFYFTGELSRNKMRSATVLFKQSSIEYFKTLE